MEWRQVGKEANVVRDYNKANGYSHCTDEHIQIRRDIDLRRVSLENSSVRPIGIAITSYYGDPLPPIGFILAPGEVKAVGINSQGSAMQFINILDPVTGLRVGSPAPFRTDCNTFVLRDGQNSWFVHNFQTTAFRAAK
jgi:hypothetical protein